MRVFIVYPFKMNRSFGIGDLGIRITKRIDQIRHDHWEVQIGFTIGA